MSLAGRTVKGECCMADFEHARVMLRMAHKDFNALTGIFAICSVFDAEAR